jgi:hypothetical protein
MQGIIYENPNFLVFVFFTLILGGAGAYASGQAVARAWAPTWHVAAAAVGLSFFVRFLHYALFEGTLLSLQYWLVDLAVLLIAAFIGWRRTRVLQMTRQYPWLYEPAGPFAWREKQARSQG